MKMSYKTLAAAVALALTGTANAAIQNFTSGNGELFLSVRDNIAQQSYVLDLGVTMNDFIATGYAANNTWTDPSIAAFVNGRTDLSWSVLAGDSAGNTAPGDLRYMTTTQATGWSMTNTDIINLVAMNTYVDSVNSNIWGQTQAMVADNLNGIQSNTLDPSYYSTLYDTWGSATNTPFSNTAALDQSQTFYMMSNTLNGRGLGGNPATVDTYGTFTLTANGLQYAAAAPAATPIPAAVWLLGSAMVGLVGVARRRTNMA